MANENEETSAWVTMTDENEDGIYEALVPEGTWTGMTFTRQDVAVAEPSIDAALAKTATLTYDGVNNQYNITGSNDDGTYAGEWTVYVEPVEPEPVEIQYVDLGLSVNWASMNVGASAPEDYGYYVGWGELEEKDWYSWSYYTHGLKNSLTKYYKSDKLTTLEADDDIASVIYGENWRIPTKAEWQELIDNCTIDYSAQENGVNGLRFTSNIPGYESASIFIPVGGRKQDDGILNEGSFGLYWTSECVSTFNLYYNAFYAELSILGDAGTANAERFYGHNVRAVKIKE